MVFRRSRSPTPGSLGLRVPETDIAKALSRAVRVTARYHLSSSALEADDFALSHRLEYPWGVRVWVDAPAVFAAVRERHASLTADDWAAAWTEPPGDGRTCFSKQGSTFYSTHDGRFLVKNVMESEYMKARSLLRELCGHFEANPASMLNRPLGLFTVEAGGREAWLVVVPNVVPAAAASVYDLKGSAYGRLSSEEARRQKPAQFKDLDLAERGPLGVEQGLRSEFRHQIRRDVEFVRTHGLMDYSLLVALAPRSAVSNRERGRWVVSAADGHCHMHICIIDYLQSYDTTKKVGHAVKSFVLMAERSALSGLPAPQYAERFLKMIDEMVIGPELCESPTRTRSSSSPESSRTSEHEAEEQGFRLPSRCWSPYARPRMGAAWPSTGSLSENPGLFEDSLRGRERARSTRESRDSFSPHLRSPTTSTLAREFGREATTGSMSCVGVLTPPDSVLVPGAPPSALRPVATTRSVDRVFDLPMPVPSVTVLTHDAAKLERLQRKVECLGCA
eukprot:Hpha_TRINITY_DN3406_c0_g1::TRINITY_DN3406_c0_g1_i1::g.32739::m.32739/K00889/PIP5K; 1-phosphatidylinositol-4-phosphate 5-kinase